MRLGTREGAPMSGGRQRQHEPIEVLSLRNSKDVSDFVKEAGSRGSGGLVIDIDQLETMFPEGVTPFAGLVYELGQTREVIFRGGDESRITSHDFRRRDTERVLNKVWRFGEEDVGELCTAIMREFQKNDIFPSGTLQAMDWSLGEVMDNAIRHSNKDYAFVMGQIHPQSKNIVLCVYDTGQGFYNSFMSNPASHVKPGSALEAITVALEEGVTSDRSQGQGNGLFGLHSVLVKGKGQLTITSGGAYFAMHEDGRTHQRSELPALPHIGHGSSVAFQLSYEENLSIDEALSFGGMRYTPVYRPFEEMEESAEVYVYSVAGQTEGTATRGAASRMRNEVLNLMSARPRKVILDFEGVGSFTSSFADEFLAKLFIDMGIVQFNKYIELRGVPTALQGIIQRSVLQRINEEVRNGEA